MNTIYMKFHSLLNPQTSQSSVVLLALNYVRSIEGLLHGQRPPNDSFLPYITLTFSLINTKPLNLHYISHCVYATALATWKH